MKRIFILCLSISLHFLSFAQLTTDTLNLFFDTDCYKNTEEHLQKLKALEKTNISHITIQAFTDSIATDSYNQQLSNKRAYYTYFSLLKLNFPIEIFDKVEGFGELNSSHQILASSRKTSIIYIHQQLKLEEPTKTDPLIKQEPPQKENSPIKIEEQISTGEVGDKINAKNINFYPGNHKVLPQSFPELEKLYLVLKNNPAIKIEIRGHICCQFDGRDGYDALTGDNQLSVNRAYTVYKYLIDNGIHKDRVSYKGLGSTEKLYQFEKNDREKVANRRVEIIIKEK